MELENGDPNGCNIVINNLHPMILLFIHPMSLIKDLKVYFRVENP